MSKRLPEGISLRHARSCPSRSGEGCRCTPRYQAQAWSPRERKRLTRTFPTLAAAKGWRYDRSWASVTALFERQAATRSNKPQKIG